MLKLAYTDIGIHLETVPDTIDHVIQRRQALAQSTGQTMHIEPSFAAIMVPDGLPELENLESAIAASLADNISICASLPEGIEVILQGCWLTYHPHSDQGLFLTDLETSIERVLTSIWSIIGAYAMSCTWPYSPESGPELNSG